MTTASAIISHSCRHTDALSAMDAVEDVGYSYIIPVTCVVGVVLNVVNVLVLLSPHLTTSTYVHLTGLAVADLASLVLFGVNALRKAHLAPCQEAWAYFVVYIYYPFGAVTTTTSVLLTLTVSWERYIFINRPHRAAGWKTRSRAWMVVAALWLTSALFNAPRFFVFTVDTTSGPLPQTVRSPYGASIFYWVLSWIYFVVIAVGSSLFLIVLNALLIRGLCRLGERRTALVSEVRESRTRKDDLRLTWTLVVVVFVFLTGEIPSACVSRLFVVDVLSGGSDTVLASDIYRAASLAAYFLVVMQHSLNFVIYCLMNRRYAGVLHSAFRTFVTYWRCCFGTTLTFTISAAAAADANADDVGQDLRLKHRCYCEQQLPAAASVAAGQPQVQNSPNSSSPLLLDLLHLREESNGSCYRNSNNSNSNSDCHNNEERDKSEHCPCTTMIKTRLGPTQKTTILENCL